MDFSSFEKIVEFAIDREEDAIQAYGAMSGKAKVPGLKNLLLELQSEEQNHKKLLEDLNKKELQDLQIKDVLDLKISDYLVEEPLSDNVTFQDLLIFAAKKEQKAVELYTVMRDRLDRPEFIKLFDYLIEQEKNHKLKLETEYDDSVYQED
jgi:rubrerythrin